MIAIRQRKKLSKNYSFLLNPFNLTIDEIRQKEIEILSLLKNNNKIKVMKKEKNN